jgi:hypothetical protein
MSSDWIFMAEDWISTHDFCTPKPQQILVSQPLVDKSKKAQTQDGGTALEK